MQSAALGAWKSDPPVRFPGTECGALYCIDCAVIFSIIFAALYILINIHLIMLYCTMLCCIALCYVVLHYVMLYCTLLCYIALCYVILLLTSFNILFSILINCLKFITSPYELFIKLFPSMYLIN